MYAHRLHSKEGFTCMAYGLLYDFLMGQTIDAYHYFGAHFEERAVTEVHVIQQKNGRPRTSKKDAVLKEMLKQNPRTLKGLVSHTTRPMRKTLSTVLCTK